MRGPNGEPPMIAALPMYDLPELRAETDALWSALGAALQARGVAAPEALTRPDDLHADWRRPDLLLGQTCGWPYATALRGAVRLVATPVYGAEGCVGPRYRSAIVVRADDPAERLADLQGRRLAFNGPDSQSGVHALRAAVAPLAAGRAFFGATLRTGAHRDAMAAVAAGRADVAAIDCVTWALLGRVAPSEVAPLRVLDWTPDAPGLPLITAKTTSDQTLEILRSAVAEVFSAPAVAARGPLLITGAEILDDAAYDRVTALAAGADALGCPPLT
jgi:ABC-type phosphate/phosphonate transport system substrate-binding protein